MEWIREAAAIVIVFGLLGAFLIYARKFTSFPLIPRANRRTGASQLELLDSLRLSPSHTVHLVRAGEEQLVIATHASGCSLLTKAGAPKGAETS